jgi:hypothetical protein
MAGFDDFDQVGDRGGELVGEAGAGTIYATVLCADPAALFTCLATRVTCLATRVTCLATRVAALPSVQRVETAPVIRTLKQL